MYGIFDENGDHTLEQVEFVRIAANLFDSNFESQCKLVFKIYDSNNDGLISREDLLVTLSHVPLTYCESKTPKRTEGQYTRSGGM